MAKENCTHYAIAKCFQHVHPATSLHFHLTYISSTDYFTFLRKMRVWMKFLLSKLRV